MNFLQTLKYKLFGGTFGGNVITMSQCIDVPRAKQPWECVAVQSMDKISPAAMRENNADFILSALYQNGAEMGVWNVVPDSVTYFDNFKWDAKLTPNAVVAFPMDPSGKTLVQYFVYQKGTIYLYDLYDMGERCVIPIVSLTPEQDRVFRHAIEMLAKEHKIRPALYPFNNVHLHEISAEEISRRPYRMLGYFQRYLELWQLNNPLKPPVRCDGCKQNCYMGYQKHCHTYMDGNHGYDHFPTINHIFAGGCHGKCATKIQEYVDTIQQKQR